MPVSAAGVRIVCSEPSLDPLLLSFRLIGNRIAGRAAGGAGIAFIGVVERDRNERLRRADDDVRESINRRGGIAAVAAEIGMERLNGADEVVVRGAVRIDRRGADVDVPPVVRGEEREGGGGPTTICA